MFAKGTVRNFGVITLPDIKYVSCPKALVKIENRNNRKREVRFIDFRLLRQKKEKNSTPLNIYDLIRFY